MVPECQCDGDRPVRHLPPRAREGLSRSHGQSVISRDQGTRLRRWLYDRDGFSAQRAPAGHTKFEVRFETPPGEQAQVDFAQFHVVFTEEPTTPRIVWLFSMVLGQNRLIWARFVMHQNLPTALRCHVAAFEAHWRGVPREILYDRMKTAVICEGQTEASSIIGHSSTWLDQEDDWAQAPHRSRH